jgi:hypothetical protein
MTEVFRQRWRSRWLFRISGCKLRRARQRMPFLLVFGRHADFGKRISIVTPKFVTLSPERKNHYNR